MDKHLKTSIAVRQRLEAELSMLETNLSDPSALLQLLVLEQEFESFIEGMRRKQDELKEQLSSTQKVKQAVNAYENVINLTVRQS